MFWWGIFADAVLGVGLAIIILLIDRRRRNGIENAHRKIIKNNTAQLREIYAQVALDVDEIETDEEGIPERLNKYMERNYSRVEHAINNMEIHRAQRTNMSETEKSDINQVIDSSRTILDTYCRRDVPESRRASLWKNQSRFRELHKKMVEAASRLDVE